MNFGDSRLPDRFWNKVTPCPMTGCWLWIGAWSKKTKHGSYGAFRREGAAGRAGVLDARPLTHVFAFVALVGPISAGLELDHKCRVRCCCNPAHLEPVSHHENLMRGAGPTAENARRTACRCGRPYDRVRRGQRECTFCIAELQRKRAGTTNSRRREARRLKRLAGFTSRGRPVTPT